MEDKLIFVITPQLVDKLKKHYPQLGNGLIITRMMMLSEVHEAYMNALSKCLSGEDRERFNEIKKLVNDEDKTGQKKWIEDTNQKFGIEEYRVDRPGWEVKLAKGDINIHSRTSDVTQKKVDEISNWISSWVEKQNEKDIKKDKIDWYKERLIFTPLDLIIDHYELGEKNPKKLDIDEEYWNVMAALEKHAQEWGIKRVNPDKYHRYDYLWCFERVCKEVKKDDMIEYCDKTGLSQFYQNVLDR